MEKGKHIDETIPDGYDIITLGELKAWLLSMAESVELKENAENIEYGNNSIVMEIHEIGSGSIKEITKRAIKKLTASSYCKFQRGFLYDGTGKIADRLVFHRWVGGVQLMRGFTTPGKNGNPITMNTEYALYF